MENTNIQEFNVEEIQDSLDLLLARQENLVNAVSAAQSDVDETVNNIDPVNAGFLSEHNLKNYSRIIDCSTTVFGNVFKVSGNQSMDEAIESFRNDLVDNIIVSMNPTYNYKRYSDPEKNNLVGAGTIVFNDFEEIEDEDNNIRSYYQVKIIGDTEETNQLPASNPSTAIDNMLWGNEGIPKLSARLMGSNDGEARLANNVYYVMMLSRPEKLPAGTTFELLNRDGNVFTPSGMYLEIYYKANEGEPEQQRVSPPTPANGHGGKPHVVKEEHGPWLANLILDLFGADYIEYTWVETYPDGCVRKTDVSNHGVQHTYWTTSNCR